MEDLKMKKWLLPVFTGLMISTAAFEAAACSGCGCRGNKKKTITPPKKVKAQLTCPVMGGKINKEQFVDVKGKRIYVCCAGCKKTIKANPDKYINKLEKEGVKLEKIKTCCPKK